jgi:5-methyltetrahydropteroyltriglutamate--homocysteine methyltransferase
MLALKLQEDCGIDIVSDGERRASISCTVFWNRSRASISPTRRNGIRNNRYSAAVPTLVAPLRSAVCMRAKRRPRAHTTARKLKFTLPGPMTIVDTIADTYYGDRVKAAMAFAALLNEEARALAADGVDVIQFDEPAFNVYMNEVKDWGIAALHRAIEGLTCTTAVHICYGYGIKANIDWKATLGNEWRQYQ